MITVHERGEADDPLSALKGLGEQNTFHYWVMASNIVAIIALYRASEKIRNGIARNAICIYVTRDMLPGVPSKPRLISLLQSTPSTGHTLYIHKVLHSLFTSHSPFSLSLVMHSPLSLSLVGTLLSLSLVGTLVSLSHCSLTHSLTWRSSLTHSELTHLLT